MSHIQRRGSRWRARYRAPDGRELSKTFDTRRDAERFLATTEADKVRGAWTDPALARTMFATVAEEWMASRTGITERTRINLDGRLRNYILPVFGTTEIGRIRAADVRRFVAGLDEQGLAPSTIKPIYNLLARILTTAEMDGLIQRSPCSGIDLPRRDRSSTEMAFLDAVQVLALAAAVDPRYEALILTAAYTGLRAGELAALRVEDINFLHGRLTVHRSAAEVRGRLVVGPTKTGARRAVPLPRFLVKKLEQHVERYSVGGIVFTSRDGTPLRHRNFMRRHFNPAVAAVNKKADDAAARGNKDVVRLPPGLRFHDLRHTCCALLIRQGAHPKVIQAHLGHSSIRVTLDRYGHLFPGLDDALADGLDALHGEAVRNVSRPGRGLGDLQADEMATWDRLTWGILERTTGFEPATLTLAR